MYFKGINKGPDFLPSDYLILSRKFLLYRLFLDIAVMFIFLNFYKYTFILSKSNEEFPDYYSHILDLHLGIKVNSLIYFIRTSANYPLELP